MKSSRTKVFGTVLFFAMSAVCAFAQAISTPPSDKGFYQYTAFGIAHDDSAGWISEAGFGAGYDFNRHFTVESGIPVYFVQHTDTNGGATQTSRAIGDWFGRVIFTPVAKPFHFATALTGTAPTGNQDLGVSAGEPTWNWLNHIDKTISRYTPFGEFGFTNSIAGDRQYQRSFTTVGNASILRGGVGVNLAKIVSVEFSGYSVHGFGSQKIYSRKIAASSSMNTVGNGMSKRPFDSQHFTSGDSTLADDNGFNASLYINPTPRFDVGISYNRSVSYELNTVSASVGYRFGHVRKAAQPE